MTTAVREANTALKHQIQDARKRTEELFSTLRSSYLYERPIRERHRVIFYVGHLDAFDYIQICREGLGQQSNEPALDALFQAGIDPDSNSLPVDTPRDWPSPSQVDRYVAQARTAVDRALDTAPADTVYMSLEHRLMHLETLAYMWHNFDYSLKLAPALESNGECDASGARENSWCDVPGGAALLGKSRDGMFGWDNEYDEYSVDLPGFRMQQYKVTNGEYLRFVQAGAPRPHFWIERDGKLYWRGMFREIPLPLDWPVYVTQREAAAYAQWIGKALPTEEQYQRAAFGATVGTGRKYAWGDSAPVNSPGNFDFRRWDPEPVDATPADRSAFGIRQLCGNGWEWTQTVFAPFAGFQSAPSYPGYSANFFDGRHYVIKGGSPRTAAQLLRRSFRNWFRPEYPYVYAGFRCVDN
jgi:formylglycine-generating enzyme required for sulfatase activity